MRESVRAWAPVAAWVGVILAATAVPLPPTLGGSDLPLDKAVHAVLYGTLGWLVARALQRSGRGGAGTMAAAFVAGVLFGAADELLQTWVPGRAPTTGDWLADVVGLAAGLSAAVLVARRGAGAGNGTREGAYRSRDAGDAGADSSGADGPGTAGSDTAAAARRGDAPGTPDDGSPETRKDEPQA